MRSHAWRHMQAATVVTPPSAVSDAKAKQSKADPSSQSILAPFSHSFYVTRTQYSYSPTQQHTNLPENTTVTFHASNTNTSSTCSASFLYPNPPNSTAPSFPTTRRSCSPDKYFGWTFSSFDGIESFVIDLTHTYQDPEVGDPPLDWVTTFGHRNITAGTSTGSSTNSTEAQYVCTSGEGVGAGRSCSIAEGTGPILVKITEAIAKRR
ncbi:hypothetical protein MMC16_001011 [Acarospora aff. strigata]|nr:hypothetical protein [Acarospora aff. strigata]